MTGDINDVLFPRVPKTKADRQRDSYNMLKCRCGAVAGLGQTKCGRCRQADEPAPVDPLVEQLVDALQMAKHIVDVHGTQEQIDQVFDALEAAGVQP